MTLARFIVLHVDVPALDDDAPPQTRPVAIGVVQIAAIEGVILDDKPVTLLTVRGMDTLIYANESFNEVLALISHVAGDVPSLTRPGT